MENHLDITSVKQVLRSRGYADKDIEKMPPEKAFLEWCAWRLSGNPAAAPSRVEMMETQRTTA